MRLRLLVKLFLIGCFAIGCGKAYEGSTSGRDGAEVLVAEPSTYDFGSIPSYARVKTSFFVLNHSNEAYVIEDVRATCDCTVPTYSGKVIEPGGSVRLDVSYNPEYNKGDQVQEVTVFFSDSAKTVRFALFADVQDDIEISPFPLRIYDYGQAVNMEITMRSKSGRLFSVEGIGVSANISAMNAEEARQSSAYTFHVSLKGSLEIGTWEEQILLEVDHPDIKEIRIPVIIESSSALLAYPSAVSLTLSADQLSSFTVNVTRQDSKPFAPRQVTSQSGAINIEFSEGSTVELEIRCTVNPAALVSNFDEIRVVGDESLKEDVIIPITYFGVRK